MTAPATSPTASTETVGSSAPPGGGTASAPSQDFRFQAGPNVPEWAVGKTPHDILNLSVQAVDALARFNQAPQALREPAPSAQASQGLALPLEDDAYVDGRTFKQILTQLAGGVGPQLQSSIDLAASTARGLAQQKYDREFKRYGPEIEAELARLPRAYWTLDNIEAVVKFVRGNHVDEIAEERARTLVAAGESSFRSQGGTGLPGIQAPQSGPSLESEELPADYRALLQKAGVTRDTVREFCRVNNMTETQWFEQAKKWGSALVTEKPDGSLNIERGQ